jgi:putative membrane protein
LLRTSSWTWQPHPDAWLLVVLVLGGYLYALSAWGPRYAPGRRPATPRQRTCFLLGAFTLWLAADWPIHGLANRMFSIHMFQHMLFSLVAAPLLILGTPGWLLRRLLRPRPVRVVWARITRPLPALILFSLWIAVYHWPVLVNLSVRNDLAHFLVHVVWVGISLVMWWPVLSPLPEFPHLSYPGRMAYLFGQSILPTVPASFLTFSERLLYRAYENTPTLWGLSRVEDQQIAGLLMKVVGGFLIWGVIAAMFFRWYHEQETGGPDLLYWRDLEPDLEPRQLSKSS